MRHARNLQVKGLIRFDEGIKAFRVASHLQCSLIKTLELVDFRRLRAQGREFRRDAFKDDARFKQITHTAKTEFRNVETTARYGRQKVFVVQTIAGFPKRRTTDLVTGQDFRFAQKAPFRELAVQDTALQQPISAVGQGTGIRIIFRLGHHLSYCIRGERILKVYRASLNRMPVTSFETLVPPHVLALQPYEPGLGIEEVKRRSGLDRVVKLASNENPLGVSPLALEHVQQALSGISQYPSGGLALRERLAELFNLKVGNVIAGTGSEGIMANILRTFLCDEDEVLTTEAAFQGFQVLARGRGVKYRTVPYRDWQYDLPALADAISPHTKLVYLANPNNPTGTFFPRQALEQFHRRVPDRVLIILDEAYYEFALAEPAYPDSLHYRFDNVITLRTFSKAYGLAAARVGYGFAHENLISFLLKVKLPFEPSGIAEAAALGAIEDREFMLRTIANNAKGLAYLMRELKGLGLKTVPSAANFILITFPRAAEAKQTFEALLNRGVIVRPLGANGLPACLRISVGTPEDNEYLIEALKDVRQKMEADSYVSVA